VSTNEALLAHMLPLMLEAFNVSSNKVGVGLPCNLRGKVKGISERAVGNNVSTPVCLFQRNQISPSTVHEAVRRSLLERNLITYAQLMQSMIIESKLYMNKELSRNVPGVVSQWNCQIATPYHEVDFGVGRPTRMQPWSGETVKLMRSLRGGIDVMVTKHPSYGIATWARNRYASLIKCSSLCQFALVFLSLRNKSSFSGRQWCASASLFMACILVKKMFSKAHCKYVDRCFQALEEHAKLHPLVQENMVAAVGGA